MAIAPGDALYDKMVNNVQEVKARGGAVLGVLTDGDARLSGLVDGAMFIPNVPDHLTPIVAAVPLQLFAYHIAVRRGCDVDQPRNLAKSVTVE
jgi:glucosamine--fructose-6-phosphate aminotransferase (isomerizing)